MAYIANKICRFGGKDYIPGEEIPLEIIPPFAAQRLLKQGIIINTTNESSGKFSFPIVVSSDEEGTTEIDVSMENLKTALMIVQNTAEEAVNEINVCEDSDVLLMVNLLDSRKSVQSAAEKKSKTISEEGGGE